MQAEPTWRSATSVLSLPMFAASAPSGAQTELTVRWVVPPAPVGAAAGALPAVDAFQIAKRAVVVDEPVRERDPQISADELVVVAVNAQGREVGWQHLKDPRVVRSEQPGPDGLLTGRVLHRS